jgi:hypothetical protein
MKDGEEYDGILHAIERLGCAMTHKIGDLGKYRPEILGLAQPILPLKQHCEWYIPIDRLYDLVRNGRNDAFHQGAQARHLTTHAIELALMLEDVLMEKANVSTIGDYMVRGPVCASLWQPISFIRQQMLIESFSYLPLWKEEKWHLISDGAVAIYLLTDRKSRLADTVEEAINKGLTIESASIHYCDDLVTNVFQAAHTAPMLICRKECISDLIGIVTAFDLL